ncbi:hypothetical protein MKX03_032388 [Papaver bracteatum]|nr:hypothetical protein MKX03_032388 [Papaver bracteatum]
MQLWQLQTLPGLHQLVWISIFKLHLWETGIILLYFSYPFVDYYKEFIRLPDLTITGPTVGAHLAHPLMQVANSASLVRERER